VRAGKTGDMRQYTQQKRDNSPERHTRHRQRFVGELVFAGGYCSARLPPLFSFLFQPSSFSFSPRAVSNSLIFQLHLPAVKLKGTSGQWLGVEVNEGYIWRGG